MKANGTIEKINLNWALLSQTKISFYSKAQNNNYQQYPEDFFH